MTETWLDALDLSPLSELCPLNYLFLNSPRTSGRGGGIATVYKTVPTCDNFLIHGDFNIHVCCPSKPLASEFLQLIESFNFTQFVSGSTHRAGHTLDLVLSLGLSVTNVVVNDACFSDRLFVLMLHFLS